MSDHRSDQELETEKKSFIREQIERPLRGMKYYLRLAAAVAGGLVLFGVVAGCSCAFVLNRMGLTVEKETESTVAPSYEWNLPPETDVAAEETGEETEAENETSNEAEPSTEASDAAEMDQAVDSRLQELSKDGSLAGMVHSSVYSAYESARHSLVKISRQQIEADPAYPVSAAGDTFGVIVAMSDFEAVVLYNWADMPVKDGILVTYRDSKVEGIFRQRDELTGIASLTINLTRLPELIRSSVEAIPLDTSHHLTLGDPVLLAGSPLGVTKSVLAGNVAYIDREVTLPDTQLRMYYTDVPSHGGSGILLNSRGELAGWINSQFADGSLSGWVSALGIPELRTVIEHLALGLDTASMGVTVQGINAQMAQEYELPEGLYVLDVDSKSAAYDAGIQNGDVIISINGTDMKTVRNLERFLYEAEPGEEVAVTVMRYGREEYKEVYFTVKLGKR